MFNLLLHPFNILTIVMYLLIIAALIDMYVNRTKKNWRPWLIIMAISIFIGISPFVALAYLFFTSKKPKPLKSTTTRTIYKPDGSYEVYQVDNSFVPKSTARMTIHLVSGLIMAVFIGGGLLIVGIIIMFSAFNPPSSGKGM